MLFNNVVVDEYQPRTPGKSINWRKPKKGKSVMTISYDRDTAQFLAVVAQNMPEISGDVMQGWIQNPKALQNALRVLCPPTPSPFVESLKKFDIWITIEIGGISKQEFVPLLEGEGFFVGDWAKDMMKQDAFTVLPNKQNLKLARCKVRDLGFAQIPTTRQLQQQVKELGGLLCPAEVGPHLRRQLKDQPNEDVFWLVMEEMPDSN
ncbi:MAG TPA: hypothetical protein VLG69_01080, partial [Candidatus Andersenbacteria bacterium]|nr:hypothetical protein [Candidatus Andersenbacteria bacterium]